MFRIPRALSITSIGSTVLAIAVLPGSLSGQRGIPFDSLCAGAVRASATNPDSVLRAGTLSACGPRGVPALARLIRQVGNSASPDYLERLWSEAREPDAAIFQAAEALFENDAVRPQARVFALQIMLGQAYGRRAAMVLPDNTPYERMTERTHCLVVGRGNLSQVPNVLALLRHSTEQVYSDPASPPAIRAASICARQSLRPHYYPPIPPTLVQLTNICQTAFRVTSRLDTAVYLGRRMAGGPVQGIMYVPPRGSVRFFTDVPGTVELLNGETVLLSAQSSTKRCVW